MNLNGLWVGIVDALNLKIKVLTFVLVWVGAYVAFVALYFLFNINNPIVFLIGCAIAGIAAEPIYRNISGGYPENNDGVHSLPY